jgi:WD40 repeat protein
MSTHCVVATLEGHTDWVNTVSYSPDGSKLASGSCDNTIKIWDMNTHCVVATLEGHTD